MQPQFRSLRKSGWPGTRNCSPPTLLAAPTVVPRKLVLVADGGVSGRPLPYCMNAPIFQSLMAVRAHLLLNQLCVVYRILALNRNGWSIGSSDLSDSTKRMGRISVMDLDHVN